MFDDFVKGIDDNDDDGVVSGTVGASYFLLPLRMIVLLLGCSSINLLLLCVELSGIWVEIEGNLIFSSLETFRLQS